MAFKAKYATRRYLQRAIEQTIQRLGLVDTYAMKDSIRVGTVTGDIGNIQITINCIYYYVFQDLGTVNLDPNFITEQALKTSNGQKFIEQVYQDYVNYIDQNYSILDTAKLTISGYKLLYSTFGDPTGQYNGIYDPNIVLKV